MQGLEVEGAEAGAGTAAGAGVSGGAGAGAGGREQKAGLREVIRKRRASTPPDSSSRSQLTAHVTQFLRSRVSPGSAVLAYAALGAEPNLDPCLDAVAASGVRVFLPVVVGAGQPLMFGELTGRMGNLPRRGKWHIREPEPTLTARELVPLLDVALLPGLAFSTSGYRLGNGGGFYDRTFGPRGLSPLTCPSAGVCFACEDGADFPTNDWDLCVDAVITDAGVREVT